MVGFMVVPSIDLDAYSRICKAMTQEAKAQKTSFVINFYDE